MKTYIAILIFGITQLANAGVVVLNLQQVEIDGQPAGTYSDALINHPGKRQDLAEALEAYVSSIKSELAEVTKLRDDCVTAYEVVKPKVISLGEQKGVPSEQITELISPLESLLVIAKTPTEVKKLEELKKLRDSLAAQKSVLDEQIAAKESELNK